MLLALNYVLALLSDHTYALPCRGVQQLPLEVTASLSQSNGIV